MTTSSSASKVSNVRAVMSEDSAESFPRSKGGVVYPVTVQEDKQVFTDAVHYCIELLKQSNRLTNKKSDVPSIEATLMGHEMFARIIGINVQMDVETEEEGFADGSQIQHHVKIEPDDTDYLETSPSNDDDLQVIREQKKKHSPANEIPAVSRSTQKRHPRATRSFGPMVIEIPADTMADFWRYEKRLPPSPVSLPGSDCSTEQTGKNKSVPTPILPINRISLELKQRVVNLVRQNPNWTIQQLREETKVPNLKSLSQIKTWEKQIDNGGTLFDKFHKISRLTYEQFLVAREKSQFVTADQLREWAIQAARDIYGSHFKFEATAHWVSNFRKRYNLQWTPDSGYFYMKGEEVATMSRTTSTNRRSLRSSSRLTSDEH